MSTIPSLLSGAFDLLQEASKELERLNIEVGISRQPLVDELSGIGYVLRDFLQSQEQQPKSLDFISALKLVDDVFAQYKIDYPKWWKRMDGTPILNDIPVRIAQRLVGTSLPPAPEES